MDRLEGDREDPLGLHRYAYTRDNPANRNDLSGLKDYALRLVYAGMGASDYVSWGNTIASGWYHADSLLTGGEIIVDPIRGTDDIFRVTQTAVAAKGLVAGTDRIVKISILGHGRAGNIGGYNDSLTADIYWGGLSPTVSAASTPQKQLMSLLRPYTQGHCTVYLLACNQADGSLGKDFMQLLAVSLGANVVAYEGDFFISGLGDQYTAYSNGTIKMTKRSFPISFVESSEQTYSAGPIPY